MKKLFLRFTHNGHPTLKLGTALAALLLANIAQATDSAKLLWSANGHYYQQFDRAGISWSKAKTACEALTAHLATITSYDEQLFIQRTVLHDADSEKYYFLGGMYNSENLNWKWNTGEPWNYQDWFILIISFGDYLTISPNNDFPFYSWGSWMAADSDETQDGYICEWGYNNTISTAVVPDLNHNGSNEMAALWVDYKTGKHTVQIKDLQSKAVLSRRK